MSATIHNEYLNSEILRNTVLRNISALVHLGFFGGYIYTDEPVEVYSCDNEMFDNINCRYVDSLDNLDIVEINGILCTSFNQTVNDLLSEPDNIDESALAEALSNYYHRNNRSFEGLVINDSNSDAFESIRSWAIEFYDEV